MVAIFGGCSGEKTVCELSRMGMIDMVMCSKEKCKSGVHECSVMFPISCRGGGFMESCQEDVASIVQVHWSLVWKVLIDLMAGKLWIYGCRYGL